MAEVGLDQAQVDPGLEQMGGVGVAQGVGVGPLADATLPEGPPEGGLEARAGHGARILREAGGQPAAGGGWEQPVRRAMGPPVLAEQPEGLLRQRDVAIPPALAVDVELHAGAVYLGHLQPGPLHQAQPAGVERRQADAVDRDTHLGEDAADLLAAEHDGQLLLPGRTDDLEQVPLPPEGLFEQDLDPAQGDGDGVARELLAVLQVEEVLPQFLLGDLAGGLAVVLRELADGRDVGLLRSGRVPPERHVLDHALPERCHGSSPFRAG